MSVMLMVTDFWAWKHVAQAPRACVASTRLWRGVDSRWCTRSLKLTGRRGGLIIYHGVMLKVELESDGRLHSVLIEGLRRKTSESRSLFNRKKVSDTQFGLEPSGLMEA